MKIGVGVGMMILNDNKILLGLRNPDRHKAGSELKGEGTWTMPGGKVDFKETLINAAIRETKEETGLEVQEAKVITIQDDFGPNAHYVTVGFLAEKYTGHPKAMEPETILEWRWFPLDSLPENVYPASKKVLEKFERNELYAQDRSE